MVHRSIGLLAGVLTLVASAGCNSENKRWEAAQEAAEERVEARAESTAAKAIAGEALNPFFPDDGVDGFQRTFEQEKEGFVQAKYTKDGVEATLSISDLNQNEDARSKFTASNETLGSDPLVTIGKNQTVVLVANRWQVKVSSPGLDPTARKALLERFDLQQLRTLKANAN